MKPSLFPRVSGAALAFMAAVTIAGPTFAQADDATTKAARARFQEGVSLFDKGQYEAARAAFLQAYALRKHPAVLLNLAQSSLKSGRALEAAKYFQQFLREASNATPAQKNDAERGLSESRQKIGRIEVSAPVGSEISVDGAVVGTAPLSEPVDVEPGNHTVKARLPDGSTETKSATARAGEKVPVQLTHTKEPPPVAPAPVVAPTPPPAASSPPPPPPPQNPPPPATEPERTPTETFTVQPSKKSFQPKTMAPVWIGLGVAVVGAGTGVAFYLFKQDALDSAKRTAKLIQDNGGSNATCASSNPGRFSAACKALQDDVNRSNTDNTIANVGMGVGIAGAAFALGWYLFAPKKDAEPQVGTWQRPIVSPMIGQTRGLSVQASF